MGRVVELKWNCGECSTKDIRGSLKQCPACGSPREKGEMKMEGLAATDYDAQGRNKAATVTDPELLKLATAGADWFCSHCTSGNKGDGEKCSTCGAPRYGQADEDHPDFQGDHKKVTIGDDPWEEGYDPQPDIPPEAKYTAKKPEPPRWQNTIQEEEYDHQAAHDAGRQRMAFLGGGAALVLLAGCIAFAIWAFQTHEVEGTVSQMTWQQSTIREHWTDLTVRKWRDETHEVREVPPTGGQGERAGMMLAGGCREEHHHDEKYVCGQDKKCKDVYRTEQESYSCTKSESYVCGETCSNNGNGFATCSDKYCTRQVPDTCYRDKQVFDHEECWYEDRYCTRPIAEIKCDFRTQEWRTVQTVPASGSGNNTRWPEVEVGTVDRLRYAADYTVTITYQDRGKPQTHEIKPGDTSFLGMSKTLTHPQALSAEQAYKAWDPGEAVTLNVNNLGGVHSVNHGGVALLGEKTQ
jgi:hypothetical protein